MSKLTNGKIPIATECPFKNECDIQKSGGCRHFGVNHRCEFSCAVARAFDLIQLSNKKLN